MEIEGREYVLNSSTVSADLETATRSMKDAEVDFVLDSLLSSASVSVSLAPAAPGSSASEGNSEVGQSVLGDSESEIMSLPSCWRTLQHEIEGRHR